MLIFFIKTGSTPLQQRTEGTGVFPPENGALPRSRFPVKLEAKRVGAASHGRSWETGA